MRLQLNLLPYAYYNTLGFDPALIDYIDHIDDTFLLDMIDPLYSKGGRSPTSPITYFRMHYLYFTRPEITSFRELCRQLKDHKNHAWRSFIGVPNPAKVPSHQSLSEFRTKVGPERFEQIRNEFIRQAVQIEGFIQDTLAELSIPDPFMRMSMATNTSAVDVRIGRNAIAKKHSPTQMQHTGYKGARQIRTNSSSAIGNTP
jgi:hypothetical protein